MADRYPGGWPPRPGGGGQDPFAELRDLWAQIRSRLGGDGGGSGGRPAGGGPGFGRRINPWIILGVLVVVWLATGVYIVRPDERGIVMRFGRVVRESPSGPGYHLPWPIETVLKPSVTAIRKAEIGFRTVDVGPPARYQEVAREALMLTGDENIVKLEFIVQYRVRPDASGATDFLFNVREPDETVRNAAEAAMREVIGRTNIDEALTEGKEKIQQEAQRELQEMLDMYRIGVDVVVVQLQDVDPPDQVSDAFKDVISAQQDRERLINEALGYANDVVPRARGQAAQLLNESEGYKEATVREAEGSAQRFVATQEAYATARDVTRQRLYLETMEAILPPMNKILMDDLSGKQAVPYLPLEAFLPRRPPEAAPQGGR